MKALCSRILSVHWLCFCVCPAPYSEPQLAIGLPRPGDPVTLTVKVVGGYPRPTLLWLNAAGSDITNQSHTKQSVDSRGLYQIQSELEAVVNEAETFTFELDHPVMEQRVSRAVTLHPSTGKGMWREIGAERAGVRVHRFYNSVNPSQPQFRTSDSVPSPLQLFTEVQWEADYRRLLVRCNQTLLRLVMCAVVRP